jgi:hypothetical protein
MSKTAREAVAASIGACTNNPSLTSHSPVVQLFLTFLDRTEFVIAPKEATAEMLANADAIALLQLPDYRGPIGKATEK